MANDHIADDRKKVRLIDANEFWNRLSHVVYDIFTVHEKNGQLTGTASVGYYTETIEEVLKQTKTVDAAPVVHAHWEDGCAIHNGKEVYKSIDCSHCNDIFKIESHDREYWKKRFKVCPFCGAIMDGERRTNEPEEPV